MTGQQYIDAITSAGLMGMTHAATHKNAALALDIGERTSRRYASDGAPLVVELALCELARRRQK